MASHRFVRPGQIVGMLKVIQQSGLNAQGRIVWLCVCNCGNEIKIPNGNLSCGRTNSCGCVSGRAAEKSVRRRKAKTAWKRAARVVDADCIRRPNSGPLDLFLYGHPAP